MHHSTKSKKLIDVIHDLGLSADYSRILWLKTQLSNTILDEIQSKGAYPPSMMRKGEVIFFAVDYSDFSEDTAYGKETLLTTATALHQRRPQDGGSYSMAQKLVLTRKARDSSMTVSDLVPRKAPNRLIDKDLKSGSSQG